MSPEVCMGEKQGFKADVWAAGVILYRMCSKNFPFNSEGFLAIYIEIVESPY